MSIGLMTEVWRDEAISCKAELLLMLALADFSDDEGRCWPSIATLAKKTRTNPRNVQRMMERLKAKGWVTVELNSGLSGSNFYTLAPRHQRHPWQNATPRRHRQGGAAPAPPIPPALSPYKPSVEPSENHQEIENVDSDESTPLLEDSESDSPETEEAPPQESAAPPPPPEGLRRAPRMPPPRPQAPEPPRTRREDNRLLCPTEDGKTLPRKPQEAGGGVSGVGLTAKTVVEEWNRMAEANGLPRAMTVTKGRAKALAARFKDAFWVQLWREAIDEIPKDPFRLGHNDRGWKADIDYFLQPDRVAKLIEQRQTKPGTGSPPPPTAGRSSKCPHPPGSPEWEKWYLANG